MKSIQLHPLSLLVGLVAGVAGLMLMSQSAVTTLPTARVEVGPHPRDMVQIVGTQPYTVPPGKILTITALGLVEGSGNPFIDVRMRINGQEQARVWLNGPSNYPMSTVASVPPGLTAHWGDVVQVVDLNGYPQTWLRAWGYLADR